MLPIIKAENERGEVLNFSASPRYFAMLTGTGSPAATINRTKVATADGTRYNSGTVNERSLVLTIYIRQDVARARRNLYRFFATKSWVKIYYQADDLDVFIEGYVETAEVDPWVENQNMQVSIICPMPYWQDVAETYTDASNIEYLFEFPFSIEETGVELSTVDQSSSAVIENNGTVEAGVIFELTATMASTNPKIYNLTTGQSLALDVSLETGDRLVINTTTGKKSVTHIRGGVSSNYINTVAVGSSWLQMAIGTNEYSYTVDSGECRLGIYHTNMYTGV